MDYESSASVYMSLISAKPIEQCDVYLDGNKLDSDDYYAGYEDFSSRNLK